ncbi:hypothetical protein Anas_07102 [Armadillidium nasatum]|uniref:Uncharacterized protein n=1 Tax=Armadillidium nasatum TaxID=96803 RepID=A0A5N5SM46_9CRUS|nr:hypothetical protein Anas_07102 [Armadillidium nasatum]
MDLMSTAKRKTQMRNLNNYKKINQTNKNSLSNLGRKYQQGRTKLNRSKLSVRQIRINTQRCREILKVKMKRCIDAGPCYRINITCTSKNQYDLKIFFERIPVRKLNLRVV